VGWLGGLAGWAGWLAGLACINNQSNTNQQQITKPINNQSTTNTKQSEANPKPIKLI
jgi:hypothetical protein